MEQAEYKSRSMFIDPSSIYIWTSRAHSQMTILPDLPRPDLILRSYLYAFFFIRQAEPSINKVIFARDPLYLEKAYKDQMNSA